MITEKLQNAINEQITAEMWSSNLYLAMSFYMEKEGYNGVAVRPNWTRLMLFPMTSVLHWKCSSR